MNVDQLTDEISGSETVVSRNAPPAMIPPSRGMTPSATKRFTIEKGTPSSPTTQARSDGC